MLDEISGEHLRFQKSRCNLRPHQKLPARPEPTRSAIACELLKWRSRSSRAGTLRPASTGSPKRAKIGPGILYLHFATGDDLLAAVYICEVEKLVESQRISSVELPPPNRGSPGVDVGIY
jgi:hypothetical protein